MTLEQINAKLKEAEEHNTRLAERKRVYAERIKAEFGADSTDALRAMREQVAAELSRKEAEFEAARAEAERLLRQGGAPC